MKKSLAPIILAIITLLFFWKFFLQGLLPIPADTITGMYHPWRDLLVEKYPNGIPFKNFLITDPVRQQYPWRQLAVNVLKKRQLPLWNPYTFGGTPLLANLQSAVFYPLNIIFFVLNFDLAWSFLVILQPLLAGFFLYFYLRYFRLKKEACFLGAFSFAFSGFFIAWLEWNTVLHSALWLPLILLSVEKIRCYLKGNKNSKIPCLAVRLGSTESRRESRRANIQNSKKMKIKNKKEFLIWFFIFLFSLASSFFAGHLQTFFYVFLISVIYTLTRLFSLKKEKKKTILLFVICYLLFTALGAVQWLPTLKLISSSARELDQLNWQKEGWFIPWQHLIQFLAPDFFGNPSTLNYWGSWNYGEFVGYIGILPLIMAFLAMIWRKDKKTLFFGIIFFLSLIFALPTWLSKLPYQLKIPFLSTSQPTRLLFLTDFSLAILAALGFDYWLRRISIIQIKSQKLRGYSSNEPHSVGRVEKFEFLGSRQARTITRCMISILIIFSLFFVPLWIFILFGGRWLNTEQWVINLAVAKRNLIFPSGIFIIIAILLITKVLHFCHLVPPAKPLATHGRGGPELVEGDSSDGEGFQKCKTLIITVFLLITIVFDLFRFGWKFTPFTKKEYLFPSTKLIEFLKKDKEQFRFMTTDKRIFPANFSIVYKLQTINGYDPLYSLDYGELIIASERGKSDISVPFGFNRIITPQNYESRIIDLLNVKYILSFDDLDSEKLVKVFEEGKTRVYENQNVFPRAFLVSLIVKVEDKQDAIEKLFDQSIDLHQKAIVYDDIDVDSGLLTSNENIKIVEYSENKIILEVNADARRLLVLVDNYYPDWRVFIDDEEDKIYQVNYNLRGVVVPSGKHQIRFDYSLQR